jgi:hypothetical protein
MEIEGNHRETIWETIDGNQETISLRREGGGFRNLGRARPLAQSERTASRLRSLAPSALATPAAPTDRKETQMTDKPTDDLPTKPSRQQLAAQGRSQAGKITGRLRRAIQSMIWEGLTRRAAAEAAGLKEHSLYVALRKSHVRAALLREMEVLRTSERPRNILALVNIRDFSENDMARLGAAKTLEALSEESTARTSSVPVSPGLVIQIVAPSPTDRAQDRLVDVTPPARPMIEHEPRHEAPRTDIKHDFIPISEVEREPVAEPDPIPIEEPPPAYHDAREEFLRSLEGHRLAPAGMKGISESEPRRPLSPRASRFRGRRGE